MVLPKWSMQNFKFLHHKHFFSRTIKLSTNPKFYTYNICIFQPDILTNDDRFKCSLHRVQSLDRMNQVHFINLKEFLIF